MQNNSYLIERNPLLRDELYIYFYIHVFLSKRQIDIQNNVHMLKIKNLSSGSYLLSQRQAYILYISTCNYYTAVSIQVQYSIRVLTDGVYVSGSSIVDTRRGYDEVFNTKLHYNMPGLYTLNVSIVECMGRVVDVECVCTLYIHVQAYGISNVQYMYNVEDSPSFRPRLRATDGSSGA